MTLFRLALLLALSLAVAPAQARGDRAGNFNYLTLVLSWSPTYCASREGLDDTEQCGVGRAYAFVVHGLWPQHERGWPEYCDSKEQWVNDHAVRAMLDVMPSKRLVVHEWKKHGTCSGLGQGGYFRLTRDLFKKVVIPARYIAPQAPISVTPEQLVSDFRKTNAWLKPEMVSVQCGNRRDRAALRDLRICFGRDMTPRDCGANERPRCRAEQLVLPPVR